MLDKLYKEYIDMFNEEIELPQFVDAEYDEKIKILKQCLEKKEPIYKNKYFNENFFEN